MADAVTNRTLFAGGRRARFHFTNISDGTGEAAVKKVDKSELATHLGVEPDKLIIERAHWSVFGFSSLRVLFDHDADDVALVLAGQGAVSFVQRGVGLPDPMSDGGTGDILFTTGAIVGGAPAGYQVTLDVRLV